MVDISVHRPDVNVDCLASDKDEHVLHIEKRNEGAEPRRSEESRTDWSCSTEDDFFNFPHFSWRADVVPFLNRLAFSSLPTYIQTRFRPSPSPAAQSLKKRRHTAYLDGMRGWASLVVVVCHFSYTCHDLFHGYGWRNKYNNLLRLPFFRLLYDGDPMVAIFFVISGYSLSYKPLKVRQNAAELSHAMCSAAFRRCFRLFLPCAVSTLIVVLLVQVGIFELTRPIATNARLLTGSREPHPIRYATLTAQMRDWSWKFFNFINPWAWTTDWQKIEYDTHLWTIPVEMRASIVLFATQLGVLQLRPRLRLMCMMVLMYMTVRKNNWVLFEFFAGFVLADLDLQRLDSRTTAEHEAASPLPRNEHCISMRRTRKQRRVQLCWNLWWLSLFIVGAYFCSQPTSNFDVTPGWRFLTSLIPVTFKEKFRFWEMFGAPLLVWSTSRVGFLQRMFDNPFSQYLGKISFALYLVHGTIIHTFGYLFLDFFWSVFDTSRATGRELGFAASGICLLPIVFWAADIFWRAVDKPVVRFTHYLERVCFER